MVPFFTNRQFAHFIDLKYPQATVLPHGQRTPELSRPELGYTDHSIKTTALQKLFHPESRRPANRSRNL